MPTKHWAVNKSDQGYAACGQKGEVRTTVYKHLVNCSRCRGTIRFRGISPLEYAKGKR